MKRLNNYINDSTINEWVFSDVRDVDLDTGYCDISMEENIDYLVVFPRGKAEVLSEFGVKDRIAKMKNIIKNSENTLEKMEFKELVDTYEDLLNIKKCDQWFSLKGEEYSISDHGIIFTSPLGIKFSH